MTSCLRHLHNVSKNYQLKLKYGESIRQVIRNSLSFTMGVVLKRNKVKRTTHIQKDSHSLVNIARLSVMGIILPEPTLC